MRPMCMHVQALGAKPPRRQVKACARYIDAAKRREENEGDFLREGSAYRHYQGLLRRAGAIDFNDMLLLVRRLMAEKAEVLTRLRGV